MQLVIGPMPGGSTSALVLTKPQLSCLGEAVLAHSTSATMFGEHVLPRVSTYTYLGITLPDRLGWTQHIDELLCQGERKLAACVSCTQSTTLPLLFVLRIFHSYVRTVCLFRVGVCTARCSNSPVSNWVNKMGPTFAYLATWQPSCRCPGPTRCASLKQQAFAHVCSAFLLIALPRS